MICGGGAATLPLEDIALLKTRYLLRQPGCGGGFTTRPRDINHEYTFILFRLATIRHSQRQAR